MARGRRVALGGFCYHVVNRGNDRKAIFEDAEDYRRFLGILSTATDRWHMRLLAYCLMPNHWHLVLWPRADRELSAYVGWVSNVHVCDHQRRHGTRGLGHVYKGRYKSFVIQRSLYLWNVLRYVEANPLRAGLVARAEDWPWSSVSRQRALEAPALSESPVPRPPDWLASINASLSPEQLGDLRMSVRHGRPYGEPGWAVLGVGTRNAKRIVPPRGQPKA